MNIKEIAKKYKLTKSDYWLHPQSGKYIVTHDACEKIASQEGIMMLGIITLNSTETLVRFLVSMKKGDVEITSVGEAQKGLNTATNYIGCIAEKRGVDRCILKLINAHHIMFSDEDFAEGQSYDI